MPASLLTLRAANALDRVEAGLRDLPLTEGVRELHSKWTAYRSVLEGIVFGRPPALTETQSLTLMLDIARLESAVAEAGRERGR